MEQAIYTMMKVIVPQRELPFAVALGFLAFWLLNMIVIVRGNAIKVLEAWAAPFPDRVGPRLARLGCRCAGGFDLVLSQPSRFTSTGAFLAVFIPSLTAMVGFWGHPGTEHSDPALRGSKGAGVGTIPAC